MLLQHLILIYHTGAKYFQQSLRFLTKNKGLLVMEGKVATFSAGSVPMLVSTGDATKSNR